MADISFYAYLEAAFRYRLNDRKGKLANLKTKFNDLGYNFAYERIFSYARRILPRFYSTEFPNTEQGNLQMAETVLQNLERQQDPELEDQFKGIRVSQKNQQIIEEARAESQTAAVQQPVAAGTIAGAGRLPPISTPRLPVIHNIPQTKPPDIPSAIPGPATATAERLSPKPPAYKAELPA
ncbi:hypothetical protein HY008_00815, partial [Candidatus Woesebacteria bacterium]|nr:hypothetical protein [Candidatus Woesebacteria bacterium]